MLRQIKFRGIRVDNSEWVEGLPMYLTEYGKDFAEIDGIQCCKTRENYDIVPETVSQYTNLKDKNGKEIFEGDILSEKWKVQAYQNDEGTFMVKFHNNSVANKPMSLKEYLHKREIASCKERDCLIIGNVFDNPELLEVSDETK